MALGMVGEHSADHDEETPAAPALLVLLEVVTRTLLRSAGGGAAPAEQQHRALESEEAHPFLVWFFNTTVLLFAVGTTWYAVRRSGCLGIYGPWQEDDLAAPAADWRESTLPWRVAASSWSASCGRRMRRP
jgi:hypothetical protein